MRRSVFVLALASLSIVGFATHAIAGENKLARGTVVSLNADAVTIAMPDGDHRFAVDNRTTIEAVGAGTMTRRAMPTASLDRNSATCSRLDRLSKSRITT